MQAEECAWLYLHGERIVYEKLLNGVAKLERVLEEKKEEHIDVEVVSKKDEKANESGSGSGVILCIDRLREELSCAMYLEMCFELSTTSCGHNFCKKCVRSTADKCGKRCPKCSNGRSCTINIVLWNTIRLLFRKKQRQERQEVKTTDNSVTMRRRRRNVAPVPEQAEDVALAMILQREEFMGAFRGSEQPQQIQLQRGRSYVTTSMVNLRAMASRFVKWLIFVTIMATN
ncbi:glycosyltransferase family 92 protein [Tanacetum coccineum]